MALVAVVGATGGIGQHVVQKAALAGHQVRALARSPENVPPTDGVEAVRCDVRNVDSIREALAGVEVVLSCLGNDRSGPMVTAEGTRNLLEGAVDARKLVAISSVGVGDSRDQGWRLSWFFMAVIAKTLLRRPLADLEKMEQIMGDHPLTTVIVRPTGLTNGGPGPVKAVGTDEDLATTVSRVDVAAFLVTLIDDDTWDDQAVTFGRPA